MRIAGIMSGTSLDGIDVAIVDFNGARRSVEAFRTAPYPSAVRQAILSVSNATTTTGAISRLNFELGALYAKAVRETCRRHRIPLESIDLIGCHGQTIYHESGRNTMQIGEPAVIAERLGIPVVSDFRTRDIAAGGKGAPLAPFADYLLFRHPKLSRAALNIGGIANVALIPAGARPEDVVAFDTGPGNMVIDSLVQEYTNGRQLCDLGGAIAAKGTVSEALLAELVADPYYRRKPPKTAGREQYCVEFLERLRRSGLAMPDLIATATSLTAVTIARAITGASEVIVSGGGVHNREILRRLGALLPGVRVASSREFGVDPDAKEAIAFAILARETWRRRPGNLPSATGAKHAVILGRISWA